MIELSTKVTGSFVLYRYKRPENIDIEDQTTNAAVELLDSPSIQTLIRSVFLPTLNNTCLWSVVNPLQNWSNVG